MNKAFRYFYMRYFFPYDPTELWLLHAVKSTIACSIAAVIALYEYSSASVWIFLPTTIFMLTVDINKSLPERIKFLLWLSLSTIGVVTLMAFLYPWVFIKTIVFLVILFIGIYFDNFSDETSLLGFSTIIFALVGYVLPVSTTYIVPEVLNFIASIVICLAVTFFIFPQRLYTQIRRQFHVTSYLLGRYMSFVLADAMRGNAELEERDEALQHLLELHEKSQAIFEKIVTENLYVKSPEKAKEILEQLQRCIYTATGIENTLYMISQPALFQGPFAEFHRLLKQMQMTFEHIQRHEYDKVDYVKLNETLEKIEHSINSKLEVIEENSSYLYRDYLNWQHVVFNLRQFLIEIKALNGLFKEFGC